MLKRLVVALVGLVGVVVIALGVASATLWRADDVLVADLQADENLVVTDPGVLELAASEVTVRAEADGPVVLAIGRDTDVSGWVGTDAHQRVTGLAGWHELAAEDVVAPTPQDEAPAEGDVPAATVPDPTGSDLWVAEATGDGAAEITWEAQPGRWSVLAASTDGSPLRLSLAWPQVVTTPWLWPCVAVGALLLLVAAGLLLRDVRRARRGADEDWVPVLTGPLPTVDEAGGPVQLTRRQLRELAAHGAAAGTGVRAPRDDAPQHADPTQPVPADASTAAAPAAATAGRTSGASDAHADEDAASTGPGRGRGALAGMAPATRRALRAVTSLGSNPREDQPAAADAPETAGGAPATDPVAPAARTDAAPVRGDRPAWRPSVAPGTPASADPARSAAPSRSEGPAPAAARPAGRPDAPVPAGSAPAGVPSAGSPRWSVGGDAPSPWAAGPSTPARPGDAPAASGPAHPQGRPAWLGAAAPSPGARPAGGGLPAPGAPGSPDAPRSARPAPAGPTGGGRSAPNGPSAEVPTATGRPGAPRPGWAPVPPPPGPVAGRASDASARPAPAGPAAPVPGPDAGSADAPRPAWLRDAPVPSGPRAGASEPAGGSRADAWRRAWGLASTDDDTTSEEER